MSGTSLRSSLCRVVCLVIGLLAGLGQAVAADALVTLAPGQSAIVFMIDGQGRGGELQVRDDKQSAAIWISVLAQATVCQFTVRPGAYSLVLLPNRAPISVSAVAGRATVVSLSGESADGAYRLQKTSEVEPGDIDSTGLGAFVDSRRVPEAAVVPTSLEARGTGLTFAFRTDL